MDVDKEKALSVIKSGHEEFKKILEKLTPEQIESPNTIDKWAVKDVVAHITAWYWEWIREIDSTLSDNPIMNEPSGDDTFNEKALKEREGKTTSEILKEWEDAYSSLIKRIENLS